MKVIAFFVALVLSAQTFYPLASNSRSSAALNESLFTKIANMDLWTQVKDSNDYGARSNKKLAPGSLSANSYVPDGRNKSQYANLGKQEEAKKAANYDRNVKKAGKVLDYTLFYKQRGTDTGSDWKKPFTLRTQNGQD